MSTLLDEPPAQTTARAHQLRSEMAAMRLAFTWLGTRKALSREQRSRAADAFQAESKFLSAGKKLVDTSDPDFRILTSVKTRVNAYFKGVSLPYPEPGIRLIQRHRLDDINAKMRDFSEELASAVAVLGSRFEQLKREASLRLGDLYCEADYPCSLDGLFDIKWDFPSVEPPSYLKRLNPELYQAECDRVKARFEEAVVLAESAFAEELSKLIDHLADRLAGTADGKPKVFRDSAIKNFSEFFQRFRHLNIRSCEQLDDIVDQAHSLLDGVNPQEIRDSNFIREQISSGLSGVKSSLDVLLVDRPRRNILRRRK